MALSFIGTPGNDVVLATTSAWTSSATAPSATTRLNYDGYFYATKVYNAVFNDYAEYFAKGEDVEAGDVIAALADGTFGKSSGALDARVVGVFSDDFAQCIGGKGDGNDDANFIPVGMAGRVRVKVTGDVHVGDLLVASEIPGVASVGNQLGCIIGKALESHTGDSVDRISAIILLG